jgi:alpha-ketoglutarate-dependent taurine dioxygenase
MIDLDAVNADGFKIYRGVSLSEVMKLAQRDDVVDATEGSFTVVQDAPMRNSLDASWHQDGLSYDEPPSRVLLYCEAAGRADITTDLADVESALKKIDPVLKNALAEIARCYVSRSGEEIYSGPLLRTDAVSGREYLSLCSRGWVRGTLDATLEQVTKAMYALFDALDPVHCQKWEAGDCLIFDNIRYVHRRHNPHNHIDPERRLIRIWFK